MRVKVKSFSAAAYVHVRTEIQNSYLQLYTDMFK